MFLCFLIIYHVNNFGGNINNVIEGFFFLFLPFQLSVYSWLHFFYLRYRFLIIFLSCGILSIKVGRWWIDVFVEIKERRILCVCVCVCIYIYLFIYLFIYHLRFYLYLIPNLIFDHITESATHILLKATFPYPSTDGSIIPSRVNGVPSIGRSIKIQLLCV